MLLVVQVSQAADKLPALLLNNGRYRFGSIFEETSVGLGAQASAEVSSKISGRMVPE
ncbi:MAG: hypothetical protein QF906_03400 [Dehalococcoidales bacterium]|jgi:hypothetical protein|nr:hypothetical protein [Dehalococcoidales bacterium]MDP7415875.1 hypothetical protein [Dehalococcoidales bacterium]